VAYSSPIDACATVEHAPRHLGNGTRWIALVRRNQCSFTQKVGIMMQIIQHVTEFRRQY